MELKPCPFCGGRAKLYERKDERPLERWYVECTGYEKCEVLPHTYPATKLEAIEAWNTRDERTCRIKEDADTGCFLVCSECGAIQPDEWTVYYCWCCGAKVVKK